MNDGHGIPAIGLGVWRVPDPDVIGAVHTALDAGYRHIDTAALYGNERGVGEALRSSGIPRGEVFVTTKVWNDAHGFASTLDASHASLDRLGLDYVDLLLIHWPTPARDLYREAWRGLLHLREEGRARSVGVSNFHAEHLERIIEDSGVTPAVNQVELHPWLPQRDLRALHDRLGIVTEAWSPLGSGRLLDDPTLIGIADRLDRSPAQILIRWSRQLGNVVLPKSVTPTRIRQNLDVDDFSLSDADMATLRALDSGRRTGPDPDSFNSA